MNLLTSFALFLACATVARAAVKCDGELSGTVNDEVLVDGTSCSVLGATINGPVTVINNGELIVEDGTTINGDITSISASNLVFLGYTQTTTINGDLVDEDGSGEVYICDDVVFNRDVFIINRYGSVEAGVTGCSPSTFTGTATITGGEGLTDLENLNQSPRSLLIADRSGSVYLYDNAPLDTLEVYDNQYVDIEGMTVFDRAEISGNGIGGDNPVNLWYLTVYGDLIVMDSKSVVQMEEADVKGEARFINNSGGVVSSGGDFGVLDCEGNAEPIDFYDGRINVGKGQCAKF